MGEECYQQKMELPIQILLNKFARTFSRKFSENTSNADEMKIVYVWDWKMNWKFS